MSGSSGKEEEGLAGSPKRSRVEEERVYQVYHNNPYVSPVTIPSGELKKGARLAVFDVDHTIFDEHVYSLHNALLGALYQNFPGDGNIAAVEQIANRIMKNVIDLCFAREEERRQDIIEEERRQDIIEEERRQDIIEYIEQNDSVLFELINTLEISTLIRDVRDIQTDANGITIKQPSLSDVTIPSMGVWIQALRDAAQRSEFHVAFVTYSTFPTDIVCLCDNLIAASGVERGSLKDKLLIQQGLVRDPHLYPLSRDSKGPAIRTVIDRLGLDPDTVAVVIVDDTAIHVVAELQDVPKGRVGGFVVWPNGTGAIRDTIGVAHDLPKTPMSMTDSGGNETGRIVKVHKLPEALRGFGQEYVHTAPRAIGRFAAPQALQPPLGLPKLPGLEDPFSAPEPSSASAIKAKTTSEKVIEQLLGCFSGSHQISSESDIPRDLAPETQKAITEVLKTRASRERQLSDKYSLPDPTKLESMKEDAKNAKAAMEETKRADAEAAAAKRADADAEFAAAAAAGLPRYVGLEDSDKGVVPMKAEAGRAAAASAASDPMKVEAPARFTMTQPIEPAPIPASPAFVSREVHGTVPPVPETGQDPMQVDPAPSAPAATAQNPQDQPTSGTKPKGVNPLAQSFMAGGYNDPPPL